MSTGVLDFSKRFGNWSLSYGQTGFRGIWGLRWVLEGYLVMHSRSKRITMPVPIFAQKGYFFNGRCEFAKSRKWWGIFMQQSAKFWIVTFLMYSSISICVFRMFGLLCVDILELYPYIRSNENTTFMRDVFSLMQLLSLSLKRVLHPILRKNRALLLKGAFYWASKPAISVEEGVLVSSKIHGKGVFILTWVRAWYTLWSGVQNKQDCFLQKEARVCVSNAFVLEDSMFK